MSSGKETHILPSSRAIRERYLSLKETNRLLPFYTTVSEFMQRAVIATSKTNIDADHRVMLLLEASDFKSFSALNIERNFFTFLTNSSYIFRFFEELSAECVAIDTLESADTYAEYEEHIAILKTLYERYRKLCDDKGVYEKIFLPHDYTLNKRYIESLGSIVLHVEGYLTNFELTVLQQCSELVDVTLYYEAGRFNKKLTSKFHDLGLELQEGNAYRINFNTREIESERSVNNTPRIVTQSFSQRLLQVGFVKQRIYEYINSGIDVERIVVVTPDENFANMLRDFDHEGNFNFAKGMSLVHSKFYRSLKAVYDVLDNATVENRSRAERFAITHRLESHFKRSVAEVDFEALLVPFMEYETDSRVRQSVHEALYTFTRVLEQLQSNSVKSALHLFLKRVATRSLDDVGGGKITVMGLLETRMITFEGVIIVDFNEGFVPRRSEKDLFLNSKVRERANLPTLSDRESLQKLYYSNLIGRAKEVSISYVSDTQNLPSRFLKELGIAMHTDNRDAPFSEILLQRHPSSVENNGDITGVYDFSASPLSASKLKTFLTCKRAFYYQYIQKLRAHEIERDLPSEHQIGTVIHEVLKKVYTAQQSYASSDALRDAIAYNFEAVISRNILHKYQLKLWLKRLEPFIAHEIERFQRGVEVLYCEKRYEKKIGAMTLSGIVDRVDRHDETIEILDYKSGAYRLYSKNGIEKATDFQLEFYYHLVDGSRKKVAFYDLKACRIVEENFLEEKLERLDAILSELHQTTHFSFDMTEDLSACRYCDYIHLCKRG